MRRHRSGWFVAACVLAGLGGSCSRAIDGPLDDAEARSDGRDPLPQERHASQDTCPENGRIDFREISEDGVVQGLEFHCGGWLDHCRVDHPEKPHLEGWTSYPRDEEDAPDDPLFDSDSYPLELAQANAIWRVAEQSRWRSWESCSGEGARPRWEVEIDDGDMAVVDVSCDGQLSSAWRATFDSLQSLKWRR